SITYTNTPFSAAIVTAMPTPALAFEPVVPKTGPEAQPSRLPVTSPDVWFSTRCIPSQNPVNVMLTALPGASTPAASAAAVLPNNAAPIRGTNQSFIESPPASFLSPTLNHLRCSPVKAADR